MSLPPSLKHWSTPPDALKIPSSLTPLANAHHVSAVAPREAEYMNHREVIAAARAQYAKRTLNTHHCRRKAMAVSDLPRAAKSVATSSTVAAAGPNDGFTIALTSQPSATAVGPVPGKQAMVSPDMSFWPTACRR
ncbi:unnamed protein product [Prorocentrum cordatum]|uniref:Uncharacterized protein n=1 Tax=Prorocentrum cordatum TaxID=2364126 RepID=A0ABN9Y461_9DINO|nr:unnamed protein product [Polarella glacialis]